MDTAFAAPTGWMDTKTLSMPIIQLDFVDTPYSCPLAGTQCPPKHYWHALCPSYNITLWTLHIAVP